MRKELSLFLVPLGLWVLSYFSIKHVEFVTGVGFWWLLTTGILMSSAVVSFFVAFDVNVRAERRDTLTDKE